MAEQASFGATGAAGRDAASGRPGGVTVLINPHGGTAQRPGALAALRHLLAARLPAAAVEVVARPAELGERAHAARAGGARVVAAAGGDGTLNAVAQALVGGPAALGVLPFGTRNHFARDVGVPADLAHAVDVLAAGASRRIDVGSVNGCYFLNNASIGLYPRLVELRDHERWPPSKTLRFLAAGLRLVGRARPLLVDLRAGGQRLHEPAWLVFAGNNSYGLHLFGAGSRSVLTAGRLDIVVAPATARWTVARLVARALHGHLHHRRVRRLHVPAALLEAPNTPDCAVALDGQVETMCPPLHLASLPRALTVVAPPHPG